MKESRLSQLLQLRVVVGFLGERAHFAWWPTAFFEPASRQFLEPVFVKTAALAQYHGVVEAARRVHDEHLSAGSFHLFRLPEEAEQDLHTSVLRHAEGPTAMTIPHNKEEALATLKGLVRSEGSPTQGPTLVGSISDLESHETIAALARAYFQGFTAGSRTYPYLVAK